MEISAVEIPRHFREWKAEHCRRPASEERFDRWLIIQAAGLLLGEKTGELLNLLRDEHGLPEEELQRILIKRGREWGFRFRILYSSDESYKLLIYDAARLEKVLQRVPRCIIEDKLGYPSPMGPGVFVEELRKRWTISGFVPHEVGIALGYPLEDVFGFMGLMSLPCQGACGWQVYGCMRKAQRLSCGYHNARCRALAFLAA